MATTLTAPQAIGQPFATGGDKATIPETTGAAGVASLNKGIPAECSLPLDGGGSAVRRTDINALGYLATSFQYFMQNGGVISYNADVSTAIGGYPTGARLWASLNGVTVIVRSTANNNVNTPISGTSPNQTIASGWVLDMGGRVLLATNGYRIGSDGFIEQWGTFTNRTTQGDQSITFPIPFPNDCLNITTAVTNPTSDLNAYGDYWCQVKSKTTSGVIFFLNNSNFDSIGGVTYWRAIGY